MQRHLRSLELDGLVISSSFAIGPGRPSHLWQLSLEGQNLFNNANASEIFALELLNTIEDNLPYEMMLSLITSQAQQKATLYKKLIGRGNLNIRLEKLVQLRNAEGYMAEIHQLNDGSAGWYLNAFHCSIRTIAEKYHIFCDQELDLIRSVFDDCEVSRVQWRFEKGHSCGFQIIPIKSND